MTIYQPFFVPHYRVKRIDTKKAPEGAFSFKLLTITRQKRSQRLEVLLGYPLLVQQMDLLALQHV